MRFFFSVLQLDLKIVITTHLQNTLQVVIFAKIYQPPCNTFLLKFKEGDRVCSSKEVCLVYFFCGFLWTISKQSAKFLLRIKKIIKLWLPLCSHLSVHMTSLTWVIFLTSGPRDQKKCIQICLSLEWIIYINTLVMNKKSTAKLSINRFLFIYGKINRILFCQDFFLI